MAQDSPRHNYCKHPEQRQSERFYTNSDKENITKYKRNCNYRIGKVAYSSSNKIISSHRPIFKITNNCCLCCNCSEIKRLEKKIEKTLRKIEKLKSWDDD